MDGVKLIMDWDNFANMIVGNLSDDLLDKKYRNIKSNKQSLPITFGHCYIASEAAFYLLGGKEAGWKPCYINHLGCSHWFLIHKSGAKLDLTANQFKSPIDYSKAIGKGFLTKMPSKRCRLLIKRILKSGSAQNV